MLLTGEGPLTCDWQPLWRRAGLCEGQLSRSPHSHWSRVTHTRQAKHLSLSFSFFPVFLHVFLLCLPPVLSKVSHACPPPVSPLFGILFLFVSTLHFLPIPHTLGLFCATPHFPFPSQSLSLTPTFLWPLLHFSSRTHG